MVIHIDTQLKTVFDLYNDEAQAKGITTEKADLLSTTRLTMEKAMERVVRVLEPYFNMFEPSSPNTLVG